MITSRDTKATAQSSPVILQGGRRENIIKFNQVTSNDRTFDWAVDNARIVTADDNRRYTHIGNVLDDELREHGRKTKKKTLDAVLRGDRIPSTEYKQGFDREEVTRRKKLLKLNCTTNLLKYSRRNYDIARYQGITPNPAG